MLLFEMDLVSCCRSLDTYLLFRRAKTCSNYQAINEQFVCHQYYSKIIKFQCWRMRAQFKLKPNTNGIISAQHELYVRCSTNLPSLIYTRTRDVRCETITTACTRVRVCVCNRALYYDYCFCVNCVNFVSMWCVRCVQMRMLLIINRLNVASTVSNSSWALEKWQISFGNLWFAINQVQTM